MHSRRVIVGRWYSTQDNAEDARLEGIFCLSKQPSAHVRWIKALSAVAHQSKLIWILQGHWLAISALMGNEGDII